MSSNFAKSQQIVAYSIFIICRTGTNDCKKFIGFSSEYVTDFLITFLFQCLDLCINGILVADLVGVGSFLMNSNPMVFSPFIGKICFRFNIIDYDGKNVDRQIGNDFFKHAPVCLDK